MCCYKIHCENIKKSFFTYQYQIVLLAKIEEIQSRNLYKHSLTLIPAVSDSLFPQLLSKKCHVLSLSHSAPFIGCSHHAQQYQTVVVLV